jgi:hypothetical protein
MDDFAELSFESVRAFDVLAALLEQLEPPEQIIAFDALTDTVGSPTTVIVIGVDVAGLQPLLPFTM